MLIFVVISTSRRNGHIALTVGSSFLYNNYLSVIIRDMCERYPALFLSAQTSPKQAQNPLSWRWRHSFQCMRERFRISRTFQIFGYFN